MRAGEYWMKIVMLHNIGSFLRKYAIVKEGPPPEEEWVVDDVQGHDWWKDWNSGVRAAGCGAAFCTSNGTGGYSSH